MSLLQEALKRKELDEAQPAPAAGSAAKPSAALPPEDANSSAAARMADGKNAITSPGSPPQSMPVPVLSQPAGDPPRQSLDAVESILAAAEPPAKHKYRKTSSILWIIVAAIVILTGLTVAAGFVFLIYRWLPPAKAKTSQPVVHQIAKTAATTAGTIAQPLIAPAGKDIGKDAAVAAVHPQPAALAPNVDPQAVQAQPAGEAASKPKSRFGPGVAAPVRTKTPVRWPVLKLNGILRRSASTESTALINGRMISIGQMIEDVTLVEIQADGVLLKRGNEKRFLRVGATSY